MRSTSSTTKTRSAASSSSTPFRSPSRSARSIALLLAIGAVVALPLVLAYLGLRRGSAGLVARAAALARAVRPRDVRACAALSLRSLAQGREMALGQRRQRVRGLRVACDLGAVLLVSVQVRRLQRDLRLARRGHRPDDVDLALGRRVVLVGAELNAEIEHQTARDIDDRSAPSRWVRAAPSWPIRSARRRVEARDEPAFAHGG